MLDEQARSFAKTCLENGITQLDSSANREKSKLIAKQKGLLNYENIEALQKTIDAYIEELNEVDREKNRKRVREKKKEELHIKEKLEKFSDCFGRDKTIFYIDSLIAEAQYTIDERNAAAKSAKEVQNVYRALGMSLETRQSPPDQDWAFAGGFASALAGPAAGVAVAADIQRKNAEAKIDPEQAAREAEKIRGSWKKTADTLSQKILENSGISAEAYKNARELKAELIKEKEKCELLLVDDRIDKYQLLGLLSPKVGAIAISETGSVHVTVHITGNTYKIYDSVPAVIDGSFKALLWNEKGECCGTAAIVLPVYGAQKSTMLEAWFVAPSEAYENYTVEFTKPNLWLIETSKSQDVEQLSEIDVGENPFSSKAEQYYDAYYLAYSPEDIEKVKNAKIIFESLGNWKDAEKQKKRCVSIIHEIEEKERKEAERILLKQKQDAELERQKQLLEAKLQKQEQENQRRKRKRLLIIGAVVGIFIASILFIKQVIIPGNAYNQALALKEEERFNEAIEAFKALNGYKDSDRQIKECEAAIELEKIDKSYNAAIVLMNNGNYEEAISVFKEIENYKDSQEQIEECMLVIEEKELAIKEKSYGLAVDLMASGNYEEALKLFNELEDYKDSQEQKTIIKQGLLKTAEIGQSVYFGSFWQNKANSKKEDIEWQVLEKDNDRIFVISRYALTCEQFHTESYTRGWEKCSLREWLNDNFFYAAFTSEEQAKIPSVTVDLESGDTIQDKIFLLSASEVQMYFPTKQDRECVPTEYAVSQGALLRNKESVTTCDWWLRSPTRKDAFGNFAATIVYDSGEIGEGTCAADSKHVSVRPVLWINLQ